MTKAETLRMGKIAALGCAICRRLGFEGSPACLHHPRTGTGMARRADDSEVIPLCFLHHQGADGLHTLGRKAWERRFGVTEGELVAETKGLIMGASER